MANAIIEGRQGETVETVTEEIAEAVENAEPKDMEEVATSETATEE